MKRYYLSLLLFFAATSVALSQMPRAIYGDARSTVTNDRLTGVKAVLMLPDSTKVDSMYTSNDQQVLDTPRAWFFIVLDKEAEYIVQFSAPGYEQKYLSVKISPRGRKQLYFAGSVRMRPHRVRKLKEATVTASRIKFYNKGDTIVYNADAFQLAEGSMLDALIRQLPGVELKDDGRILVNGKQVESLLLNGEDFFDKDGTLLLDNLPAYMVKNVKVYDKAGHMSEFLKRKLPGDEKYVMDVQLKKQYSIGWLGNAEAGGGTKERYLGRLFGLRFTPQSRLSFFFNANNLNETRRPGQNGDWTPTDMPQGRQNTETGGIDYFINDRYGRYQLSGSATAQRLRRNNYSRSSGVDFLPSGDTYRQRMSEAHNRDVLISSSHRFFFNWKRTQLTLSPAVSYNGWRNRSTAASALFSSDPFETKNVLDSIMAPQAGAWLRRMAVNRTLNSTRSEGYDVNSSGEIFLLQTFRRNNDYLIASAAVNYYGHEEDKFDHYLLEYPTDAAAAPDFRNRYFKDHPRRDISYHAGATYNVAMRKNWQFSASYQFSQTYERKDYTLFRLEQLEGWGPESALGALPSVSEYLSTADAGNSYAGERTTTDHRTSVGLYWEEWMSSRHKVYGKLNVELPVTARHEQQDYTRAAIDTTLSRAKALFAPTLRFELRWHGSARNVLLTYRANNTLPTLISMLGLRDDANPLSVTLGNANLRDSWRHSFGMSHQNNSTRKQRFFNVYANYEFMPRALANGYLYNRTTGVYTYRLQNIDGNYALNGGVGYTMPLDKARRLTFSTNTGASFNNNVDFVGEETGQTTPTEADWDRLSRSTVKSLFLSETFKWDYRINQQKIGVKVGGTWQHATGSREDFKRIDAGSYNYGLTGQFELPYDWQIYTDLTVYSRRGYEDPSLNTNDVVWNARIAKRLWKNRLTLMADGFDILGQLSAITHSINGQGRTETYRNVLPRYVMFHVIYRLNIQPKKRPGDA